MEGPAAADGAVGCRSIAVQLGLAALDGAAGKDGLGGRSTKRGL